MKNDANLNQEGLKSPSSLPLKKRFTFFIQNLDKKKMSKKSTTTDEKVRRIIPGVIRHGSCPQNALAYYYSLVQL